LVHGANAHYTHGRMAQVLGVTATAVPAGADGRIDLNAVEDECRRGDVGTVVLTAGSTGVGAVDDVAGAVDLRDRYGVRVHVDAAYGGFFTLLAGGDPADAGPATVPGTGAAGAPGVAALDASTAAALRAIAACDSVVVDPHKHGLQPYGCGAVLFADPSVGTLYRHDSPYTYFTSDELHLGEISLECSRAGAAAAALWLTLQVLPLQPDAGLGPILAAGRRAALDWAKRLRHSEVLRLHVDPELDIVTYFPTRSDPAAISAATRSALASGIADADDPVWLSTLAVEPDAFAAAHPDLPAADGPVTILRSVLMKPEHEAAIDWLHGRVEAVAGAV
ncbi:MAG TPA: aminotransferase class V-fold PLP-dependent enzyme, partial [Acidimicrobiales bacterium]|nr:aminotransferase class V-fold PLP-dependent enzyme [Acidimicrobiales bacterium]